MGCGGVGSRMLRRVGEKKKIKRGSVPCYSLKLIVIRSNVVLPHIRSFLR